MDSLRSPLTPDVMRLSAPPFVPFHFRSFGSRAARSHHPACRPGGPPPPAAPPRRSRPSRSSTHLVLFTTNHRIYRVHAGAFPARALPASGGLQFSLVLGGVIAPLSVQRRSTRRGAPRPSRSAMPGACVSRLPLGLVLPISSGATARVRRPTLTARPSSAHLRSQLTLPTAPSDRSRPHNPACSGLRFAALARR